jgi:uncharacterized protein YbjT (DUF2867 family)
MQNNNAHSQQKNTTLVLGGNGKTGRRIAAQLTAQGMPVRIGSRSGQPPFEWNDRATWKPLLSDVRAAYIAYYPDLAVPGAVDTIRSFIDQALAQGVQRLVLLSGRGEEEAQRAEQVLQESQAEWTILRCSWFSQNFSENFLLDSVLSGEIVLPAGTIQEPFVDADDIADVAIAALSDDRHIGQLYELTGPRLLTFAEATEEIAKAVGRDIRYVQVSAQEYAAALAEAGLPSDFQWLVNYLFATVLDGRNAHVADGVQRALGRAPRDFADYAQTTAAAGIWKV